MKHMAQISLRIATQDSSHRHLDKSEYKTSDIPTIDPTWSDASSSDESPLISVV